MLFCNFIFSEAQANPSGIIAFSDKYYPLYSIKRLDKRRRRQYTVISKCKCETFLPIGREKAIRLTHGWLFCASGGPDGRTRMSAGGRRPRRSTASAFCAKGSVRRPRRAYSYERGGKAASTLDCLGLLPKGLGREAPTGALVSARRLPRPISFFSSRPLQSLAGSSLSPLSRA